MHKIRHWWQLLKYHFSKGQMLQWQLTESAIKLSSGLANPWLS